VSDTTIAMRYASALFEVVEGDAAARDRARADLEALAAAVAAPDLGRLLANPRVPPADKARVLDDVAGRVGAGDTARRLLSVLAAPDRAGLLGEVAAAYGRQVDAARGRQAVTVTAAFPLPQALKAGVETRIRALAGADTEIAHRVDPQALGGLAVQIGSKVFDYTVRHHLAHLRQSL